MSSNRVIKLFFYLVVILAFLALSFATSPPSTLAQWDGGHDVVGCKEASTVWYFAEGCTRSGFNEWLCIQNPNDASVSATLTYMQNDGAIIETQNTLAPRSRTTVNVGAVIMPDKDVSVKIVAQPPVIAERPMYFNYKWMWDGGHNEMGVKNPDYQWFFAEGYTGEGFEEWLALHWRLGEI